MSFVTRAEERQAREGRASLIERLAATSDEDMLSARLRNKANETQAAAHETGQPDAGREALGGEPATPNAHVHRPSGETATIARVFPGGGPGEAETGQTSKPSRTSRPFMLDGARLARWGILGPRSKPRKLRAEIRTVKHRLTNRMNFFDRREKIGSRQQNTVLVTSIRPGEGKSFMAANLAMSFASESQVNTLLVDADALTSSVPEIFGIDQSRGLTDYLRGRERDLASLLHRAQDIPLTLLPRGRVDVGASELFGSQRMADFVEELKARYRDRMIIFDTPALLASNDALVLAKYVDEVLVVIGADSTPRHVAESALELFDTHDNVSLVLNQCSVQTDTLMSDDIATLGWAGEPV